MEYRLSIHSLTEPARYEEFATRADALRRARELMQAGYPHLVLEEIDCGAITDPNALAREVAAMVA